MSHRSPIRVLTALLVILASPAVTQESPAEAHPPRDEAEVVSYQDPSGLASPWRQLIAIPAAHNEDDEGLLLRGLIPLRHLPGWTIAGVEEGAGDHADLAARILPVPGRGEILLAVSEEPSPDRRRDLSRLGTVAPLDATWSVLLTRSEYLDEAASFGSIVQIFMGRAGVRAKSGAEVIRPTYPEPVWDPWIDARLSAVSRDTLQSLAQILQDFGTRHSNTVEGRMAGDLLRRRFRSYGYDDVWLFDYNTWSDNVVARKTGLSKPEEIVVIGGHYDSISRQGGGAPGADDNASGTVGVMEAARVLAAGDFERTLVFVAFSGEEEGLVGSEAFAAWARSQDWNVVAMINLDMIGYLADEMDLDLIQRREDQDLVSLVKEVVPLYVPDLPVVDGFLTGGSSDHASFWRYDYPAVFFFEDSDRFSPYIHTSDDVIGLSLNSFEFMTLCVKAATATVATLASPLSLSLFHESLAEDQHVLVPYPIAADISSPLALDSEQLALFYRVDDGPWNEVPLEPLGPPGRYGAEIPPQEWGARVEYYLEAWDAGGHLARSPRNAPEELHGFRVGFTDLFADDFEGDQGWTVEGHAATGQWIRSHPIGTRYQPDEDHTAGEGGMCWVTGNGPAGDDGAADVDGGRTVLLSPSIGIADMQRVEVSYWLWYVDEVRRDDTFRVEASPDNGASWTGLMELTGSLDGWTRFQHRDIEEGLEGAKSVRLRFVAEDLGLPSLVEALLDDIVVRAVDVEFPGVPDPLPASAASSLSLHFWPNPATSTARIALTLPADQEISLNLYDVSGRLVRALFRGSLPGGRWVHSWDGCSGEGRRLPAGVYWLRLERAGGEDSKRILLLR